MSELTKQALWDLLGEDYLEAYANKPVEEILAQLVQAHQEISQLKETVAYLYSHTRDSVRDIDPERNDKIKDWIERGLSDKSISNYLVDGITPRIVERIRLEMGVKKPKGRPKKSP